MSVLYCCYTCRWAIPASRSVIHVAHQNIGFYRPSGPVPQLSQLLDDCVPKCRRYNIDINGDQIWILVLELDDLLWHRAGRNCSNQLPPLANNRIMPHMREFVQLVLHAFVDLLTCDIALCRQLLHLTRFELHVHLHSHPRRNPESFFSLALAWLITTGSSGLRGK